jgi:hypothetical protein
LPRQPQRGREMIDNLQDVVHAELLKRLKKTINSKKARLSVGINSAEFVGRWQNLEVKGHATLTGFEDYWSFDFVFRNNDAKSLLEDCKLAMPARPASFQATKESSK